MIWFTSDWHFGHNKDFVYENRGFKNITDHDEAVIANFNRLVAFDDTVYMTGDTLLNDTEHGLECIRRLNCQNIYIARGNHDTDNKVAELLKLWNVKDVQWMYVIKRGKTHFYISHHFQGVGNLDEFAKNISIHGHTHSPDKFQYIEYMAYNCALDAHDCCPVSIEEMFNDIENYRNSSKKEKK